MAVAFILLGIAGIINSYLLLRHFLWHRKQDEIDRNSVSESFAVLWEPGDET